MAAKVVILLQRPEAWVNVASVWTALQAHPAFEPCVLTLPYNVEDPTLSARMEVKMLAMLQSQQVPHERWHEDWRLENHSFDAAIITQPYDRERPSELSFKRLSAAIPVTLYVPYGPVMAGGRKNMHLQFAQPTQIGATAIVARSNWEKKMYALHCPSGDSHVHVLGHPRFDTLCAQLNRPTPPELATAIGTRLVLLWNSHFSFAPSYSQSSNFSTFDLLGPELLEFAKLHRDRVCLLWRPHPGLFPVLLRERLLARDEIDRLRSELAQIGIILDESPSHVPAFNASDALLTDVGSFFLEYLVTDKPILALLNPDGEPLNEESNALVSHYLRATAPSDVFKFIDAVATNSTELPDLRDARAEHLPALDGRAGERVVDLLASLTIGGIPQAGQTRAYADHACQPRSHSRSAIDGLALAISPDAGAPETPVLDKLIGELRQLRQRKVREPRWRKQLRRAVNTMRTTVSEAAKRQPLIALLASFLRRVETAR